MRHPAAAALRYALAIVVFIGVPAAVIVLLGIPELALPSAWTDARARIDAGTLPGGYLVDILTGALGVVWIASAWFLLRGLYKRSRRPRQESTAPAGDDAEDEPWWHKGAPIFDEQFSDEYPRVVVPPDTAPDDTTSDDTAPDDTTSDEEGQDTLWTMGAAGTEHTEHSDIPTGTSPRDDVAEDIVSDAEIVGSSGEAPPDEPPMIVPVRAYYFSRAEDTLRSVAAQFLHTPRRWDELRSLNAASPGVASLGPDSPLPVGAALALPGDPLPWGKPDPVYLWTLAEKFLFTAWGREPTPEEVVPFWRGLTSGSQLEAEDFLRPDHLAAAEPAARAMPAPEPEPDDLLLPEPEDLVSPEPEPQPDDLLLPEPEDLVSPEPEPQPDDLLLPEPEDLVSPEPEPQPDDLLLPEPEDLVSPEPEPQPDDLLLPEPEDLVSPEPEPQPDDLLLPEPEDLVSPEPEPQPDDLLLPEPEDLVSPEPEPQPDDLLLPEPEDLVSPEPEPQPDDLLLPEPEDLVSPEPEPQPDDLLLPEPEDLVSPEPEPQPEDLLPPEPEPQPEDLLAPEPEDLLPPEPEPADFLAPEPEPEDFLLPEPEPADFLAPEPEDLLPPEPETRPAYQSPVPPTHEPLSTAPPGAGQVDFGPIEPRVPYVEAEAPRMPSFLSSLTAAEPAGPVPEARALANRSLAGTAIGDAMMLWRLSRVRRRLGEPNDGTDPMEEFLKENARIDTLNLIEAAMRHLRTVTVGRLREKPAVLAVRVGTYGFEVLLSRRVEAPEGWRTASLGYVLELSPGITAEDLEAVGQGPSLCPALVPVGDTVEGPLLLNLEEITCLIVSGPGSPSVRLLNAIVGTLGSSPLAGDIRIITVGLDTPAGLVGWEQVHSIAFDSQQLEEFLSTAHTGSGASLDVLVVGPGNDLLIQRAGQVAAAPGSRLALVGATSSVAARWPWRIHVDETTTAVVHPIACTMAAAQAMAPPVSQLLSDSFNTLPATPPRF